MSWLKSNPLSLLMRNLSAMLFLALSLMAGLASIQSAFAATATDEIAIPSLTQRVTDLTNTLAIDQIGALESKIQAFEHAKGSQIAVLILPTTQPEDIAQYSIRLADAWKIGRKGVADGVIIVVAKNDHKLRIEVGRGLEGAIPDIYAKRIIAENIAPLFKQGDMSGGLNAGVDKVIGLITGEVLPPPAKQSTHVKMSFENQLGLFIMASLFIGGFLSAKLGRFFGSGSTGLIMGGAASLFAGLGSGLFIGLAAFFFTLLIPILFGGRGLGGYYGGFGGGSSSGGSFSGGGGDFGGGGASGDW